ncbi:MAG TPA: ABC transporter ATP-binding protein [Acidimicrobiales bacterium]|nr:ABC transporter ATP-binding protein [Acidimicrobiales bacterium]
MPALQAERVSVRFGGVLAVDQVSLSVEPAAITGLIGPNGAGKTTIFNVFGGLQQPTEGKVLLDGRDITKLKAHARARRGMARTFQRLEIFGSLSVRDNIQVAAEIRKSWARDRSRPAAVADELIERIGLGEVAGARVDAVPTGTARLVELARALATRPSLLLLDEPGSGLDHQETAVLGDVLVDLAAGGMAGPGGRPEGMAVLLVEHDVELVMRVCDRVNVLDFGRLIAEGTPAEVQSDPAVQAAYLGADDSALSEAGV